MKRMRLPRRRLTWLAVVVLALVVVPVAVAAATNSSTDPGQTINSLPTGACVHPNQNVPVNCNEYAQKEDVFLNGSPSKSDAGTYFFAVLDPGGQPTPNDGGTKNLSDTTCDPYSCSPTPPTNSDGTTVPSGYDAVNREFTVDAAGNITPLTGAPATHAYTFDAAGNGGQGSLSVWPYDDTTNNGGVYILATCKINSDPTTTTPIANPTAKASDCKYDAFKVESPTPPVPTASDLVVTKDANGADTKTFTWGIDKTADPTTVYSAGGGTSGSTTYTINVTHDGGTVSDVTVTGTIQVFNPNVDALNNTVPVDITGVSDQLGGADSTVCSVTDGGAQTLTKEETDFTYTCDLSAIPQGELDNTVTVSWDDQDLSNGAHLAGNDATFTFSSISFDEKIVDGSVTVTDPNAPTNPLGTVSYTDSSPTQFQYSASFTDPAGTCTSHDNTATFTTDDTGTQGSDGATVKDCQGADLGVSKTANASFTRTYTWGVTKSVDNANVKTAGGAPHQFNYTVGVTHDNGTDSGWKVTGTIAVTNPNDWEAITADVTDQIDNNGNCTVDKSAGGDDPSSATIPKSGEVDFPYTCAYASAPSPTSGTNTATATWDASAASTPDDNASGPASYAFGAPTKIVDGSVSVTDTLGGTLGTVSYTDPSPTKFTYSKTFTDPAGTCTSHDNTATFTTSDTGTTGSAGQTVTDCQGADLTVSKTATPAFSRRYNWTISKSVDKTTVSTTGSSATFNYTVVASETGFTDSGWQVTGTITVTNPNDWEAISADVTDSIDNGGTCTVPNGTGVSIPAKQSVQLGYTCTYASVPSPSAGTNTGTATWDSAAASTPHGSASGTAGATFGSPTSTTNKTITPKDTFNGGTAVNLCSLTSTPALYCTLTATDASPFTTHTYNYSRTISVTPNQCTSYSNTAATGTGPTSAKTVTVCGQVTGGLTIGFWSNNNGKAVLCAHDPAWRQLLDGTAAGAPYNGGSYLRNANGTFYAVPTSGSCATADSNFSSWLLAANSSNASYMLSAQLAGVILNVGFNGMKGTDCIAGNGGTPTTISNLISTVIGFLQVPANGNTTAAGPARTLAVNYQTILNSLNNGQVTVITGC